MTLSFTQELADPPATHRLGVALGRALGPGETLALSGELGAGKTALTRGVAEGFGVSALSEVVSPTYALMFDHPGSRGRLVHIDFYRLSDAYSLLGLGVEDAMADPKALVVIEWANRLPALIPADAIWVRLEDAGDGRIAHVHGMERARLKVDNAP
ncbi:MAG: tRNA (adenosine(37)-N6)-threonylcarbamoyltransferase complex ATPase subunit type 1 TsaE [Myxococcota bacterium]